MLCYYNVLVTKNGGKNSRFPEYHWVASSMIYAFHPTTFFQLGVSMYVGSVSPYCIVHLQQTCLIWLLNVSPYVSKFEPY